MVQHIEVDWGESKKPPNSRAHLSRTLAEKIGSKPKAFFDELSDSELRDILTQLSIPVPESTDEYVPAILEEAEFIGLEHFFSSFSIEKLKEFCKNCGVEVETQSFDVALESLLYLEDHIPPKKEKKEPAKKKKPPIDLNISESDIANHYLRDELVEWLEKHSVSTAGTKKYLAQKIYATLHNLPLPPTPVKQAPRKKKAGEGSEEDSSKKRSRRSSDSDSEKMESPKKKTRQERSPKKGNDEEEEEKKKSRTKSKKDESEESDSNDKRRKDKNKKKEEETGEEKSKKGK
uniref:SAP domain-containing protein n=1 Tax=Arcella intermedia TaxID=1963864 RepID=A0A6B2L8E5_9EUKA